MAQGAPLRQAGAPGKKETAPPLARVIPSPPAPEAAEPIRGPSPSRRAAWILLFQRTWNAGSASNVEGPGADSPRAELHLNPPVELCRIYPEPRPPPPAPQPPEKG